MHFDLNTNKVILLWKKRFLESFTEKLKRRKRGVRKIQKRDIEIWKYFKMTFQLLDFEVRLPIYGLRN